MKNLEFLLHTLHFDEGREKGQCGSTHMALQKSIHLAPDIQDIVLFYFHYLILYIFISFFFYYVQTRKDCNL